jgi:hypothetical protein
MSVVEITNEETQKVAGILEAKWARMVSDNTQLKEELEAQTVRADIVQKDCDYWHARALEAEARGDHFWASMDFMQQQFNKMLAQCIEVDRTIKRGILTPLEDLTKPDEQTRLLGLKFGADSRQN